MSHFVSKRRLGDVFIAWCNNFEYIVEKDNTLLVDLDTSFDNKRKVNSIPGIRQGYILFLRLFLDFILNCGLNFQFKSQSQRSTCFFVNGILNAKSS